MITYFSMEGFLSVKKKVELYFVPKPHTRITNTRFEDNFIHTPKYKLMKAAVLFGMNASGKSNVLLGMERLISMINRGLNLGAVDDMRRNLINFDCKTVAFEIGLYDVKSDQDYVYQIAYDCEKIVSEKLVLNGQEIFSFSGGKLSITNLSGIKERDALIRLFSGVSTELYLLKLKDYMGEYITSFQKLAAAVKTNIRDIVPMLDRDDIRVVKEERKGFWENNKKRILSVFICWMERLRVSDLKKSGRTDMKFLFSEEKEISFGNRIQRDSKNMPFNGCFDNQYDQWGGTGC